MDIFKSYLRRLLHGLKEILKVQESGDQEKVRELLEILIEETQKGIEDN